ncbi:MAG: T9SS type A sorting domain-containing protein [Candidatus Zixiibacteriota bacterium]
MTKRYFTVVCSIMALLAAVGSDVRAEGNVVGYYVYVDSVQAGVGEDISIRFLLGNEQALTSFSVPITYNPELVTLKSVSFTGSRAQHLANKIVTPANLSTANGHFMVSAFQWLEDPIAVGEGLLFTVVFGVKSTALPGQSTVLDTLFYPPGGYLEVVRADAPGGIRPAFRPGRILVGEPNRAPVFTLISDQYVLEGDSLKLNVRVTDPDSDQVTLAATSKPIGSHFVDNGDGSARFAWVPDYVGPNSADGSPVKVRFWAGDGDLSSQMEVTVHVVNRNRCPVISAPSAVSVEAGETLDFSVSAVDPDFETISWGWSGLPSGASFDAANPGRLSWVSSVTDSGTFALRFVAVDPQGLADTATVAASVQAVALYTLRIDSVKAFPNEDVQYRIVLDNKLPVNGFNLLIHYDPSALAFLSLTNAGTRAADFEFFTATNNNNGIPGDVRIRGIASLAGATPHLAAGEGPIAIGRLHTSGDLAFAGMSIPLRFEFRDAPTNQDNTLADSIGALIRQSDIVYVNGNVLIEDIGEILIGDINLNRIPAEIGDVIYFTNFFINPSLYRFNALQYANSDVNRDNMAATIADLVALINWVVSGNPPLAKTGAVTTPGAVIETSVNASGARLGYECAEEIGAAFVVFETDREISADMIVSAHGQMTLDYRQDGRDVKVLLYSLDGGVLACGKCELFTVRGLDSFQVSHVELGSADGRMVEVSMAAAGPELPTAYALAQNYPNPFNPETTIEFSLPTPSAVELTVYNVLGQQVITLVSGEYPAGEHRVIWNGDDDSGVPVASGIYLYRLTVGSTVLTRKMMLLK